MAVHAIDQVFIDLNVGSVGSAAKESGGGESVKGELDHGWL